MNAMRVFMICLISIGFATLANAGSIADGDVDLIPNVFDNCLSVTNGPGQTSNQVDTDEDGFGNACDADFNQNGVVDPNDFSAIIANFNTASELHDLNGNGVVDPNDFSAVIALFNTAPGPSGLACADATIDVDLGDTPCL